MKVIDTIMFCNEFDMLELRLKIMAEHVDKIVIVECDKTFTGVYKGFNLEKQLDRFAPWMHKIDYIKVSDSPVGNAWAAEEWQRDQFARGWNNVNDNDVILISDCDEIIRPAAIDFIRNTDYNWYGLYMPAFYFKLNYMDTKPDWHYKVWGRAYRGIKVPPHRMRYMGANEVPGTTSIKLHHAGWHFGWYGNEEFARNKIQSFSHTELNRPEILNNININKHIAEGRDHFRPENVTWTGVNLDSYFPDEILNNREQYNEFILGDTGKTVQDYWTKQILEKE